MDSTPTIPKKGECICRVMRQTARSLTNAYDRALAPSSLRTTQFTVLSVLAHQTTASVTQLSEILGLDQTTTTRNLRLLEDDRLIERVAHHDPRVKLLKLTARGKQKRQIAQQHWTEIQERITSSITEDELQIFRSVLQKIEDASVKCEH